MVKTVIMNSDRYKKEISFGLTSFFIATLEGVVVIYSIQQRMGFRGRLHNIQHQSLLFRKL